MGKRRRRQHSELEEQQQRHAREYASTDAVPANGSWKRQATEGPLAAREIDAFVRDGFVLLKDAFSEATAAKCRELVWRRLEKDGIRKSDSSTWVERHGIPEIYNGDDDPLWNDVLTPRLHRAVDQLCGQGSWEEFGCGWWMITFPNQADPPWEAAGKWHVDGASYQHHLDSKESGLLAIFCFSDVGPTEGGTALSVGSHVPIAQLLEKNQPRGLKGGAVSYNARKFPRRRVVEVNGKAGDVMLVHPFLLHARSKNLGTRGVDSVRIMCNPNIRLHKKMNLDRADDAYTPVERAIVNALKN
uniref:Phytanoyl-CoA dioxygenase n=1 Tax=Globisporangium ultimum (strain ATCC 200006 / CBS 805.95 / DAOM BR144) TaxID=431595 RepID=K3W8D1_GLOUD